MLVICRQLLVALAFSGAVLGRASQAQPIVVLIGGNHSDPSPAQLEGRAGRGGNSGLWRMKGDLLAEEKLDAVYFNWNGTRAGQIDHAPPPGAAGIANVIRQRRVQSPEAPIIIVGNSWGGHTAWQVCRLLNGEPVATESGRQTSINAATLGRHALDGELLRPIAPGPSTPASNESESAGGNDLLKREPTVKVTPIASTEEASTIVPVELVIFLDPSSIGRTKDPKPTVLPQNVCAAINYYTRNSFSWNGWEDEPRLRNVDLGDPANGFMSSGGPRYDSVFNWRAHVSAEWDERIHADIRRQIRSVMLRPELTGQ